MIQEQNYTCQNQSQSTTYWATLWSRSSPMDLKPCHFGHRFVSIIRDRFTTPVCCQSPDKANQTSTEQTCGRTDQNGKKYAQHHIQSQNDQHLGKEKASRHNQQCDKNEVVLDSLKDDRWIRETSQAVGSRPGQIREGHDLAEDSAR